MSSWGNLIFTITTLGEQHFAEAWEAIQRTRRHPGAISDADQIETIVLAILMKYREGLTALEIVEKHWELEGGEGLDPEHLASLIEHAIATLYRKNSIEIEGETEDEVYEILAPGTRSQKMGGVFEIEESKNVHRKGEIADKEIQSSADMRSFPLDPEALEDLKN